MKRLFTLFSALVLVLCLPEFSCAQSLTGVNLVLSPAGKSSRSLSLTVKGDTGGKALYLGCSFYHPHLKSLPREGFHAITPVQGSFSRSWDVPGKYFEGMFDVALWGRKVNRNACREPDCFCCEKFGYHLEDLIDSCRGTLLPVGSAHMAISIREAGDSFVITAEGDISSGSAWLGSSYYPEKCRDIYREGLHESRLVAQKFKESWKIPGRFKNGRYEIALWKKQVARNACTFKSCPWCEKMGYHLWWLIFMKNGAITELLPGTGNPAGVQK